MPKAKSISAANLTKLTQAAVKAATPDAGKFIGKGTWIGIRLIKDLGTTKNLELATQITQGVAANAKAGGISGIKPKPVVVSRPGIIIAGYIAGELGVEIR